MKRKTRLWIGFTLLMILVVNYCMFGYPLYTRASSLDRRTGDMVMKQAKGGSVFKDREDQFIVEVLKRERVLIDKRFMVLNAITATCLIIILSWTGFGLIIGNRHR